MLPVLVRVLELADGAVDVDELAGGIVWGTVDGLVRVRLVEAVEVLVRVLELELELEDGLVGGLVGGLVRVLEGEEGGGDEVVDGIVGGAGVVLVVVEGLVAVLGANVAGPILLESKGA